MSEVHLDCACGKRLPVRFQDAGTQIDCTCGHEVKVPSLGKLRQLAGQDAYTTNAVEAIRKHLNLGEHPAGNDCLLCGAQNCKRHAFVAICESSYTKGTDSAASNDIPSLLGKLLFLTAAPRLLSIFLFRKNQQTEVQQFGRDTSVEITLPLCDSCTSAGLGPKNSTAARSLMRKVALYDQLLAEFPSLKLERR